MKKLDMANVQEAGEFTSLPAGKYVCIIRNVEDFTDKEYLKVTYDIAEGEYTGYYDKLRAEHPDWAWTGAYVKSYKPAALPMFKRFCSAVSKSNGTYVFDAGTVNDDERTLIGKRIGLILNSEEYYSNSGDKRTRLYVHTEVPISKLEDTRMPQPKTLSEDKPTTSGSTDTGFMNIPPVTSDEIPFA